MEEENSSSDTGPYEDESEESEEVTLDDFKKEVLNLIDFDALGALLEDNLDHEGLAKTILEAIILLPERYKAFPDRKDPSVYPLIPLKSHLFNVLLLAAYNIPTSNDAFDAMYTILDYHPLNSKTRNDLLFVALDAGIIDACFCCLAASFLNNFPESEVGDFVESVLDCLVLCAESLKNLRELIKKSENDTHILKSLLNSETVLDFSQSYFTSPTSSSTSSYSSYYSSLNSSPPSRKTPIVELLSEDVIQEVKDLLDLIK